MDRPNLIHGLSSAAIETMKCLFLHGPTWDGNIPSKSGRGELIDAGLAEHGKGHAWLTTKGVYFAIETFRMDDEKERWQREGREGV
jgi:hypothetical protein